jgi:hypothetical protein
LSGATSVGARSVPVSSAPFASKVASGSSSSLLGSPLTKNECWVVFISYFERKYVSDEDTSSLRHCSAPYAPSRVRSKSLSFQEPPRLIQRSCPLVSPTTALVRG